PTPPPPTTHPLPLHDALPIYDVAPGPDDDPVAAVDLVPMGEHLDLAAGRVDGRAARLCEVGDGADVVVVRVRDQDRNAFRPHPGDRKSTRLNSSHLGISYAVF